MAFSKHASSAYAQFKTEVHPSSIRYTFSSCSTVVAFSKHEASVYVPAVVYGDSSSSISEVAARGATGSDVTRSGPDRRSRDRKWHAGSDVIFQRFFLIIVVQNVVQ